ncbi:hypothetical protein HHI36_016880, partial [Cryptolaemus montrouzieri]
KQRDIEIEKTKKKGKWDQSNLQTAIDKMLSKEMSLRDASLCYNIPKSTLHDKTSSLNRGQEVSLQPKLEEKENEKTVNEKKTAVKNKFRIAMKEKSKQTKGVEAKRNDRNKPKKRHRWLKHLTRELFA